MTKTMKKMMNKSLRHKLVSIFRLYYCFDEYHSANYFLWSREPSLEQFLLYKWAVHFSEQEGFDSLSMEARENIPQNDEEFKKELFKVLDPYESALYLIKTCSQVYSKRIVEEFKTFLTESGETDIKYVDSIPDWSEDANCWKCFLRDENGDIIYVTDRSGNLINVKEWKEKHGKK